MPDDYLDVDGWPLVSRRIVDRMFVNGFDEQADRLVLVQGGRDLGGWCRAAVRTIIEEELRESSRGPAGKEA